MLSPPASNRYSRRAAGPSRQSLETEHAAEVGGGDGEIAVSDAQRDRGAGNDARAVADGS